VQSAYRLSSGSPPRAPTAHHSERSLARILRDCYRVIVPYPGPSTGRSPACSRGAITSRTSCAGLGRVDRPYRPALLRRGPQRSGRQRHRPGRGRRLLPRPPQPTPRREGHLPRPHPCGPSDGQRSSSHAASGVRRAGHGWILEEQAEGALRHRSPTTWRHGRAASINSGVCKRRRNSLARRCRYSPPGSSRRVSTRSSLPSGADGDGAGRRAVRRGRWLTASQGPRQ